MRPQRQLWLVLSAFVLTIAGLSRHGSAQEVPFKLGVAVPFSGSASWLGDNTRRGIQLYISEHPDVAKQITILYEDVTTDKPAQGVSAIKKLIELDHIDGLILENSAVANPAGPLIDKARLPTLAIVGDDSANGRGFMLKLWMPAALEAAAVKSFLEQKGLKRVALATSEQDSMLARTRALKSLAPQVEIVEDLGITDMSEITTIAARLARANAQATILNVMPGGAGVLARKLREGGYPGQFIVTVAGATKTEVTLSDGTLKGAVYPASVVSHEFASAFQRKFGEPPPSPAPNGYDAMKLFHNALQKSGGRMTPEELVSALKVKDFSGALGIYSFRETGLNDFALPAVMQTVGE